ncbi:helix-turn-helix transcriptional regulator [Secundilactobacillus oryzae]|nr:helix-turn-helix domain-containing protein [Secundilactobacillus oryzae]
MAHSVWVWRKALEMAQTALGDLIKVTRQTINTIENAKDDPSLALAFR